MGIHFANAITIGSYTARIEEKYKVHFGCQSFNRDELDTVFKLLNNPINAEITIQGVKITPGMINKLIDKLNK